MRQGHTEEHWHDEAGNPAGGISEGTGFTISWQNGPLGRHASTCVPPTLKMEDGMCYADDGCTRREPNGAVVEDVLAAVIGRIDFYQSGKFASEFNAGALDNLRAAAEMLDRRTKDRERRRVEGTHAA